MFQQLRNKIPTKPFKTAMHKAAQAGGTAAEEKVEKREMAGNFMAGQAAAGNAGLEKAEKVEKVVQQSAGQTVNPVQLGGKSGLALLAIIGIVIFALTQCGG